MKKSDFASLVRGVRETRALMRGTVRPAREIVFTLSELAAVRQHKGPRPSPAFAAAKVKAMRRRMEMTQAQFAAMLRVPITAVQEWEDGHCTPEGPALALLLLLDRAPNTVRQVLLAKSA